MLTTLALIFLQAFAPINLSDLSTVRHLPREAAEAIVAGVNADPEPALLGSTKAEGLLIAVYMHQESFFALKAKGDHGASLGPLQLQRFPADKAFNYRASVDEWLRRAHAADALCSNLPEEERLAAVVSGNCAHGHVVARSRARTALGLLALGSVESFAGDDVGHSETFLPKE